MRALPILAGKPFQRRWLNGHTVLVLTQPDTQRFVRRYVQLHNIGPTVEGEPFCHPETSRVDGATLMGFASMNDVEWTCFGKVESGYGSGCLPLEGGRADEVQGRMPPDGVIRGKHCSTPNRRQPATLPGIWAGARHFPLRNLARMSAVSCGNWSTKKWPPGSEAACMSAQRLPHSAGMSKRRAMVPAAP